MTAVSAHDRWLFLTPEPEAELPPAVAALAAALDEPARSADREGKLVDELVQTGRYPEWLAYLRDRRLLLERYVDRFGADELAVHVADVLHNHHQLALTVPDPSGAAERERELTLELLRRVRGPDAR